MDKIFVIGRDSVPEKMSVSTAGPVRMTFVVLPGVSCDLSLELDLDSEGVDVDIAGLYLCNSDEKVRIRVDLRHNYGSCTSRQLFKGVVGGSAKAEFNGLVYVKKGAQKTKAFQENHTILLNDGAQVETCPQLEIYADDVECSHGATTGYLNEDEQFYMRSRGIPEAEARKLQIVSFLSSVVERLTEDLKEKIYDSIS